jgi:hypothetical protein
MKLCRNFFQIRNIRTNKIKNMYHIFTGLFILTHRVTGFLDFLYRLVFMGVETRRFGNFICFRPQVKGGRRHLLSWAP